MDTNKHELFQGLLELALASEHDALNFPLTVGTELDHFVDVNKMIPNRVPGCLTDRFCLG